MTIDADTKAALKAKYRAERDKRLRPDGNAQYRRLAGTQLAHYLADPYTEFQEREPLTDHVTFTFIGGGFAGLVTGARMVEQGITDVRIIDKGGDFGGTWYWNRYPGAMCDTASFVYMPLLEETGHMPSEKYARGPEILEHCQRIGKQYGLYDNALFHTEVTGLHWRDEDNRWEVTTNRGDCFTTQFLGMGTGPLHVPKLPGIPGIEEFKGHSFHTSRWDYDYTGGDNKGAPLDKLGDKKVGIIGTGATGVQCIPHVAAAAETLYVFQRTPSSVDVRANHRIDPEWFKEIATPGWQQRWLENFTANQTMGIAEEDLVMDGWTDLSRRIRERISTLPPDQMNPQGMMAAFEDADFEKMSEIRARVESIVADPQTAEHLKAWYNQLCKRPCFHDEYLDSYNQPGTYLIDTDGKGVERITERGVVVAGVEYEVDCIIYASGFEVGTPFEQRNGFDPIGQHGVALSQYWADGMRSKHGMHVHGFPNLFIVAFAQGANLISNVPHNLTEGGKTAAIVLKHALDNGYDRVEVTAEAEQEWLELLATGPGRMIMGNEQCTPGYYNNEGQPLGEGQSFLGVGYPQGAQAYFKYLDVWRNKGDFGGLAFA